MTRNPEMPPAPATGPAEPSWAECMALLERLPHLPLQERRASLEILARNPSPGIRQQAIRMGSILLKDENLVTYLRDDADDVMRNAGLEMLKARGVKAMPVAAALLGDGDPDVVLQAVLILDGMKDPRTLNHLRRVLHHSNPNVVQAAILAIGHAGDGPSVEDILPFLKADPWLQLAAIEALGDLRSQRAVAPLSELLPDPLLGPLALQALGRIGGAKAFAALVGQWLSPGGQDEPETALGFLSHVILGLPHRVSPPPELRPSLVKFLGSPALEERRCAAECLLALGPGEEDRAALAALAETAAEAPVAPACLSRRQDLLQELLGSAGVLARWGWQISLASPARLTREALEGILAKGVPADHLGDLASLLGRVRRRGLGRMILRLFLTVPEDHRAPFHPALLRYRKEVLPELKTSCPGRAEEAAGLRVILEEDPAEAAAGLVRLPSGARPAVLAQMIRRRGLTGRLPWDEWLREDHDAYTPLLAEAALARPNRRLRKTLREELARNPGPDLIRAAGELGDGTALPTLVALAEGPSSLNRVLALEALGKIGGDEARAALLRAVGALTGQNLRQAWRALAWCATLEDLPLFRSRASDGDWVIRLACAEALTRFPSPENDEILTLLAADPVTAVSRKAADALGD